MKYLILLATIFFAGCTSQNIPVTDCHVHLYDTTRPNIHWPREEHGILYRPYLPEEFNKIAAKNNVKTVVVVLAGQNIEDNEWNLKITEPYKDLYKGIVGNLSRIIATDEFAPLFKKLCKDKRYVGYRLSGKYKDGLSDELMRDLKLTAELGRTVDFLVGGYSMDDIAVIAEKIPNLKIIVDHFGGVRLNGGALDKEWIKGYRKVAKFPNVYSKVSAMYGRFKNQPAPMEIKPYKEILDLTYEIFGEDRVVYGSDWPVTKQTGNYASILKLLNSYMDQKGKTAKEKLYHKNASRFYGVE